MANKFAHLDKLFSDYIRGRDKWTCQVCGNRPERHLLHCSHFRHRAHIGTRFDPRNADAMCFKCHEKMDLFPDLHWLWKRKRIGNDDIEDLERKSRTVTKFDALQIRQSIKEMEESLHE
jgi:hypothetical protein